MTVNTRSIAGIKTIWYKQMIKTNEDDKIKGRSTGAKRFLITISVFGSAGPIRFVVNGEDSAGRVVATALKIYAREGRLPILGSDVDDFFLYAVNAEFDALEPSDKIGSREARNFVLCRKQMTEERPRQVTEGKGRRRWRSWFQKSLSLKIIPR